MPNTLPPTIKLNYKSPPVVETVVGVQFDTMSNFTNAHLGAYWHHIGVDRWPTTLDAAPLTSQFERFHDSSKWGGGFNLQLTQDPASRMQLKNHDGSRMLQIQNGRMHHNWLGEEGGEYPRYEAVRDEFEKYLRSFIEFASIHKLGRVVPNQWEMTYVNHIKKGTVWNAPSEWSFFSLLRDVPTIDDVIDAESFAGEWHFVIPGKRGRLHIDWKHAHKFPATDDAQQFIRLTFTARGGIEKSDDILSSVRQGLDLGHETIVNSFSRLMSDEANQYWGIQHAINR